MTAEYRAETAGGADGDDVLDLEALFGDGVTLGDANEPYEPWHEGCDAGSDVADMDMDADGAAAAEEPDGVDGAADQAFVVQLGELAGAAAMGGNLAGMGAAGGAMPDREARESVAGDLVRVRPNGAFGRILGANDDATFDVELLGPDEDEPDVRVPAAGLIPQQEMDPRGLTAFSISGELVFCRLAVAQGLDVDRSFAAYLGRNEQGGFELWYEGGRLRADRVAAWSARDNQARDLLEPIAALCQEPHGAPSARAKLPSPDACRWSLALFLKEGRALSAEGVVDDPDAGARPALRALVTALAAAGCSCAWKPAAGPVNVPTS